MSGSITWPTVLKRNTSHAVTNANKVKKSDVNRANIFCRKKIKAEGSVTFQNIFSSIMADFCAVVSVLPCCPTNRGKKNLYGFAEKASRQWAFVAFWLSSYVNIKTAAAFADWLAPKKGRTFQFNLFLWVILHILHSTCLCHSTSHATCYSANSFLLLPSPLQTWTLFIY